MHILVNFMYYLRPGGGGVRRFNELCNLWAGQPGVRVTVLAGIFDHFRRTVHPDLSGRGDIWEDDGPVRVLRVASPETYDSGFVKRAWAQYWWGRNSVRALGKIDRPDVVLSSSPNLWAALPMLEARKRWGTPGVFEIRDLWPDAIVQQKIAGPGHPVVRYMAHLERLACVSAEKVVVVIDTMRNSVVERGLVPPEKVRVIPNGVLLDKYEQLPPDSRERMRAKLGLPADAFVAMYAGGMGKIHGVITFVELATELRDEPGIRFVCAGDGPDRPALEALARARGLANLQFTGSVPTDEIPAYYSAADCGVAVGFTGDETGYDSKTRGSFRNGYFDIAGAKLPLVLNVPGFPVDEIVERAQAGLYAPDPAGLADCLRRLQADPELGRRLGENNYREIAVRYNRRKLAAEYLDLLRAAAERGKG